ncbi:hypothetical protein AC629_31355 [Bradyrhizobium sp. NAS80.1]|uniref:hypothetical protein n=1 Tax=Bradyrhizobium sp. NAS80.1 TaxID=1680159 RepID=UPI0009620EF7|nr:hypothetical protein [Bradyrhizobium sp. NAS80.1]OKO77669.1 hypothetical protein AC629_31355 [Bradyrhizobium sp. NAS80.1]
MNEINIGERSGQKKKTVLSFTEFLENSPAIDDLTEVSDALTNDDYGRWMLAAPAIVLNCSHEACSGKRVHRLTDGNRYLPDKAPLTTYLTYLCSNCRRKTKIFSLLVEANSAAPPAAMCAKFGERPKFGSPTSNRLLRLFGNDSQVFLKGRQCENHGLGIGAFSYYRRVVEGHKDQLFDQIIKVATKIAPDTVASLEKAKGMHSFLNALESVKDAFPQGLLINGHNPLLLLHSALSQGLHAQSDEQCLQSAHDIRMVLAELVDRMGQLLKDEVELAAAVARLTKKAN